MSFLGGGGGNRNVLRGVRIWGCPYLGVGGLVMSFLGGGGEGIGMSLSLGGGGLYLWGLGYISIGRCLYFGGWWIGGSECFYSL